MAFSVYEAVLWLVCLRAVRNDELAEDYLPSPGTTVAAILEKFSLCSAYMSGLNFI